MEFIKKHYEKVILSVVLLGLAVAAAALTLQVGAIRQEREDIMQGIHRSKPKEFEPVNLSTNRAVFDRLAHPVKIELSGRHNLFNPVVWKKTPDNRWIKEQNGNEIGPEAVKVLKITPLHLALAYEGVASGAADNPSLKISVLNETERGARPRIRYAKKQDHNEIFTLVDARPAQNPTEVDVLLEGEKKPITLKLNEAPYERVTGYSADLQYPATKQSFNNVHVGDSITLADENLAYKIVAIDGHEVVLSADSTHKRTILQFNSGQ